MAGISAKNIRNIALLGHGGEGKTTLAEAILFNAKAIDRQGRVDDGNTTMDFDPEEIGKKISISLATANATFKGVKLNLIDVPGFFDFEGEFVQAMTVADCALVVTGPGGTLPVGTEKALDYCVAHKVPTMIFINGMDKENANYWDTVNAVSQKYSTKIVPLMIPLMENGKMTGYANVLEGLFYKVGAHGENGQPLPDSLKSKYEELKGVVMEKAAESDEELLMKFFDSGELSAEEMVKGMKQGVKEGAAIGVFGGSALANFGVFNLMNNLISMMPSAAEAKPVVAFDENDKPTELKPDENAPVVIRIFKTIADPFVGRLSLFKVVSGTLKSGLTLKNASKDSEEKISSIYFLKGKKQETVDAACAGDIGALAKLSNATTGDTLSEDRELRLPPIELPKPVLSMAVYAAKKGDEDKIFGGLNRLKDEDISFTVTKNAETNEMLLSGVGETQLEILPAVEEAAEFVRSKADNFVILGIGGSALGPIAVHRALNHLYHNDLPSEKRKSPRLFVEDNVDPERMAALLDVIDTDRTVFNVITKSGSTSETMAQLLIITRMLIDRYGEEGLRDHLIATTDKQKGNLIGIAKKYNLRTFIIPDGVGGRFSELCPVGLVAAAVGGADVRALLAGAGYMDELCSNADVKKNPGLMLALLV